MIKKKQKPKEIVLKDNNNFIEKEGIVLPFLVRTLVTGTVLTNQYFIQIKMNLGLDGLYASNHEYYIIMRERLVARVIIIILRPALRTIS